jgi:hypothetical protein
MVEMHNGGAFFELCEASDHELFGLITFLLAPPSLEHALAKELGLADEETVFVYQSQRTIEGRDA